MLVKTLATIAIMATAVLAMPANAGRFSASCSDCKITNVGHDPLLDCNCSDGHGGTNKVILDLDYCFANNHGFVVYQPEGVFGYSCNDIKLDDTWMAATCDNGLGGVGHNRVNLDDWVYNSGGQLLC